MPNFYKIMAQNFMTIVYLSVNVMKIQINQTLEREIQPVQRKWIKKYAKSYTNKNKEA